MARCEVLVVRAVWLGRVGARPDAVIAVRVVESRGRCCAVSYRSMARCSGGMGFRCGSQRGIAGSWRLGG